MTSLGIVNISLMAAKVYSKLGIESNVSNVMQIQNYSL